MTRVRRVPSAFGGGSSVRQRILSVGIDIGTSTTVVAFSHIDIEDVAAAHRIPDAQIVRKQVIYRSPMHLTPLASNTELDTDAIGKIVRSEYAAAGVTPAQVDTGAVIITGDTARKDNAELVVREISGFAGDFVVAAVGPELESILAGKGSGAEQYSIDHGGRIANLDVGGGTTNIAAFEAGRVVDIACMDVGGRLIRFRPGTRQIEYLFPKVQQLAAELGIPLMLGDSMSPEQISRVARAMADAVCAEVASPRQPRHGFLATGGLRLTGPAPDSVCFTGGVGDLINLPALPADATYDDIGVALAREMVTAAQRHGLRVIRPAETIGATVVGAGIHSMEISGSTIMLAASHVLPLRNIPILKIPDSEAMAAIEFSAAVQQQVQWLQGGDVQQQVALAVDCARDATFNQITALAGSILTGMADLLRLQDLLIVVLQSDFGKVLGQSLRAQLPEGKEVICLDGVNVRHGDYIDIGKPLGVGDALPVVVKTLAFSY